MERSIKPMENKYLLPALDLVEDVFAEWDGPEEGKVVRKLVEEIRTKKYYLPKLELLMLDENDEIVGYAMFSRFPIEGRYENELLILTPVAVKTELQRQHISRDLLEYGFERAREAGFRAVLVEGNPQNYRSRGFESSYRFGIAAGPNIRLPHPDCLMVKELTDHGLDGIHGLVDYSFYDALHEDPVFSINEMLEMQKKLQHKYKDKWEPISPETGKNKLLWMTGEIGEVIDIIKKHGGTKASSDAELRKDLVEEMADVLMYYNDTLLCYGISADELRQSYISKFEKNLTRW